jgi:hypothetical protein
VVLLTHPRSLDEADVVAAACRLADDGGTRLFVVSVDSGGQVELSALRRGRPVVLSRSRIDLAEDAPPPPSPLPGTRRPPWSGDVQPIPFPFRCGGLDRLLSNGQRNSLGWLGASRPHESPFLREKVSVFALLSDDDADRPFDFDDGGERILVIGRHGLLFTWGIDGSDPEILPRPLVDGRLMMPVTGVIGVAGGFVLSGYRREHQVLAHYDFPTRTCTLHTVEGPEASTPWSYYRDLHAVAALVGGELRRGLAFDLAAAVADAATTARALRAAERIREDGPPGPSRVPPLGTPARDPSPGLGGPRVGSRGRGPSLDPKTGTLSYGLDPTHEKSLTPLCDGRPALKGGSIVRAREGGDVLAVLVDRAAPGLYFISRSRATVLGSFSVGDDPVAKVFALSRDGQRFARLLDDRRLEVRHVPGDVPPVLVTSQEDIGIHFGSLGRSCLLVREFDVGGPRRPRASCLIRWDQGRLDFVHREAGSLLEQLGGVVAESRSVPPGHPVHRHDPDPLRWVQFVEHAGLQILIDRYNHLAVLGRSGGLIGMFYVNRDEAAAWMPDGTCLGSRRLIGCEPAPGAAERIAAVLTSAEQKEGVFP